MSTYSAIANSEIAVGAPITNSLKTKERDNLLAVQENDASAPTIAYATSAGNAATITSQGALATLNSVAAGQIDANSVGTSELKTAVGSTGSQTLISSGSSWTPSAGFYNVVQDTTGGVIAFEILVSSSWRRIPSSLDYPVAGLYWCDGTNMRFTEVDGTNATIYYQKLG